MPQLSHAAAISSIVKSKNVSSTAGVPTFLSSVTVMSMHTSEHSPAPERLIEARLLRECVPKCVVGSQMQACMQQAEDILTPE